MAILEFPVITHHLDKYAVLLDGNSYNLAWAASDASTLYDGFNIFHLQWNTTWMTQIARQALIIDTSDIPADTVINSAKITLNGIADIRYAKSPCYIVIQNGQPNYPHITSVSGDYCKDNYSGNGGQANIVGASGSLDINLTDLSWIQKESITKLFIRFAADISGDNTEYNAQISSTDLILVLDIVPTIPYLSTQSVTWEGSIPTGHGTIEEIGTGGNSTKRGICWNTTGYPTINDHHTEEEGDFGVGAFSERIVLVENTTYYLRAYAYNSYGYGYGNQIILTTTVGAIGLNPTQYDFQPFRLWPVRAYGDGDYRPINRAHNGQLIVAKDLNIALKTDANWLKNAYSKGQADTLTEYINFECEDAFTLTKQSVSAVAFQGINLSMTGALVYDPAAWLGARVVSKGPVLVLQEDNIATLDVVFSNIIIPANATSYLHIGLYDAYPSSLPGEGASSPHGFGIYVRGAEHHINGEVFNGSYALNGYTGFQDFADGAMCKSAKIEVKPGAWAKLFINGVIKGTYTTVANIPTQGALYLYIQAYCQLQSGTTFAASMNILRIGYTQEYEERL
jgi:hypothetical protein